MRETVKSMSRETQHYDRNEKASYDAKNLIPEFNPEDPKQNIETWLEKVDSLRTAHQWSEAATAIFATNKLRGFAKTWYESLKSLDKTWDEWKKELREDFADHVEFPVRLSRMLQTEKKPDEEYIKYYFDNMSLLTPCGFDEQKSVQCIAFGVKNDSIRAAIRAANIKSTSAMKAFLMICDEGAGEVLDTEKNQQKHFHGKRRFGGKPYQQDKKHDQENKADNHEQFAKKEPRDRKQNNSNSKKCYICDKEGHFARKCPDRLDKKKKEILTIGSENPNKDSRFFEAHVNGQPLRAYVDLRSQCVTLRLSEAQKLYLKIDSTQDVLRGYGGAAVQSCGVSKVTLKVDLAEATADAHIIPDCVQNVPIIVGQPFTDQPSVVAVQRGGELRLSEAGTAELPEVEQLPPRKVVLWAERAYIIPPGRAADIKVIVKYSDYKGDVYVDLSFCCKEIVNLANYPLRIDKSCVIARGQATREVTEKEVRLLAL